ncbi:wax ester/triacylglycerol synthase family O-acyltransferase [Nocardioides sp.]|uniref:wax ester/triacylglycerol synthase family O-acyltransferase n=1 Tax=Nocardioides sp. TaxID=35761 RepID=UPI003784C924
MPGIRRAVRPVDDVWLEMDQPDNLMVVEGLMVVDGELDRETYVQLLEERVAERFPRFKQRATWSWFPWPSRWWQEDPDFDIERHVVEATLPEPGDDAALQDHVSGFMSRALDQQHPLWEAHLIHGYRGGTAVYTRLHHALADGTALFRVIMSLADEDLGTSVDEPGAGGGGWSFPLLRSAAATVKGLPGVGRLVAAPAVAEHLVLARRPDSPLAVAPHHDKHAVWAPGIDVDALRPLRRATGATVTDVVMSALAGALRWWLALHGVDDPADVPTMVPVDVRGSQALRADDLGNSFALVLLDLPTSVESPLGRLVETATRMRAIKESPEAWVSYSMLQGMGFLHPRVRVLATDFFARKATGVTTSVRGPDEPLHLAGLPITRLWGWAPMSADQSFSTSIIGYGGQVHVGFKVDAVAVPDPEVLVQGITDEIAELTALAPA